MRRFLRTNPLWNKDYCPICLLTNAEEIKKHNGVLRHGQIRPRLEVVTVRMNKCPKCGKAYSTK